MKTKTVEYYNWFEDIQPEILKNLNALLAEQGIDPVRDLHGGYLADTKWVGVGEGEYVNFWHAYLDVWGDEIRNDNYVITYYPQDDDEEWAYCKEIIQKSKRNELVLLVVDAVRKMTKDHNFYDEHGDTKPITIWFSW